jgi:uncharacterized protein YggU (UPF0235/DUF167 family)
MTDGEPFQPVAGGVAVAVALTPRARAEAIEGPVAGPDGPALRVRVRAAPERGRANAAMIALLAAEWRIPKSTISLIRGASSRRKTVLVAGDSPALLSRIRAWVKARGGTGMADGTKDGPPAGGT